MKNKNNITSIYCIFYNENRYYRNARLALTKKEVRKIISEIEAERPHCFIHVSQKIIYKNKDIEALNSYLASCGK